MLFQPLDAFLVNAREAGLILPLDTEIIKAQLMAPIHALIKAAGKNTEVLDQRTIDGVLGKVWQSDQLQK